MKHETVYFQLRKLEPIIGELETKKIAALWAVSDPEERIEIEGLIDTLMLTSLNHSHQKKSLLPPAKQQQLIGEYYLGEVVYPETSLSPFGLREEEWIKHSLIVGMSGSGKTNTSFLVLEEFRKKQKPFLVFDWKKNYRDLIQKQEYQELRIYTIGEDVSPFYFNPLIPPPGVEPGQWLGKILDVLEHAYYVGHGVSYLLREQFEKLFEEHGVFNGSKHYPSFREAYEALRYKRMKGRQMLWHASTMRVLSAICWRAGLGPVMDTDQPLDPSAILDHNVILELDSLTEADKTFFTESLLLWVYEYKRANQRKRESFDHAIIIEEAHHVLSRRKEIKHGGETVMEFVARQIREMGTALIVIDQEPHKLSNSVLANTNTKMCFSLGNGRDILEVKTALTMEEEHREYMDRLSVGQAIVKVKGRVLDPLLIRFPLYKISKGKIANNELEGHMSQFSDLSTPSNVFQPSNSQDSTIRDSYTPPLSPNERKLLDHIEEFPDMGVAARYKDLDWSADRGTKIKKLLLQKGLIEEEFQNRQKKLKLVSQ